MTYTLAMSADDEALLERCAARENISASEFIRRTVMEKIGAGMPNRETLEAIGEARRMKADPTLGKTYTDVDAMMRELLA